MVRKLGKSLSVIVVNDMEGISGIDDWHQIFAGCKEYEQFGRVQVTEDVNAAVRGLRAAGATEIRAVDFHGSGGPSKNLIAEKLAKGVKLFQQPDLVNRLEKAISRSVDAAVFVGFHAMADTKDGFLRHTINMHPRIKMNGRLVGETAINAYALAEHDIPVIMVSGDQALIREATGFLPGIETAQVKTSRDSRTTKCLSLSKARKLIENAAERALLRLNEFKPIRVRKPIRMEIAFPNKEQVDLSVTIPRARRISSKAVSYAAEDWNEADRFIRTTLSLANEYQTRTLVQKLSQLKGSDKARFEWVENIINEWLS